MTAHLRVSSEIKAPFRLLRRRRSDRCESDGGGQDKPASCGSVRRGNGHPFGSSAEALALRRGASWQQKICGRDLSESASNEAFTGRGTTPIVVHPDRVVPWMGRLGDGLGAALVVLADLIARSPARRRNSRSESSRLIGAPVFLSMLVQRGARGRWNAGTERRFGTAWLATGA